MRYVPILLLLLIPSFSFSQSTSVWDILSKVSIETKYDASQKYEIDYPVFSEELKDLEGETIIIKGYIIPLEELQNQNYFILSAFPYNLCYFCGAAGPETVIEVSMNQKLTYTSNPIILKGTLHLNDTDYNHLMYILENAVLIE